eukprot:10163954-Prorocentrum_lima.AAC.1
MGFVVPGAQGLVRMQCQGHNNIRRAHCIHGPGLGFRSFITKPPLRQGDLRQRDPPRKFQP